MLEKESARRSRICGQMALFFNPEEWIPHCLETGEKKILTEIGSQMQELCGEMEKYVLAAKGIPTQYLKKLRILLKSFFLNLKQKKTPSRIYSLTIWLTS